jgi:hypothetical protein
MNAERIIASIFARWRLYDLTIQARVDAGVAKWQTQRT